jgi:hypothetical protein
MVFGGTPVNIERLDSETFSFNVPTPSSFTWAGADFGEEASDRILCAAFYASRSFSGAIPVPAISGTPTIGGVNAVIAGEVAATNSGRMAIIYAPVPTGTSGNIAVNFTQPISACQAFLYRITRAALTPFVTTTDGPDTANPATLDLDQTVVAGAGLIGIGGNFMGETDTASLAWNGLSDPLGAYAVNGENTFRIFASTAYRVSEDTDGDLSCVVGDSTAFATRPKQAIITQWRA